MKRFPARSFRDLITWQKLMLELEEVSKLREYSRAIVDSNNRPIRLSCRFGPRTSDF